MRNNQPVFDVEQEVREDQYLISRTDLDGRILYANHAFVEVSGFERDELIGAHHNIVRHPDMPPAAFADLWATIKSGKTWCGVVKNRCKDGRYYWVYATVSPIKENDVITGYGSVRVKPTQQQVETADALYKRMNAGKLQGYKLSGGKLRPLGLRAWVERLKIWRAETLRARIIMLLTTVLATFALVSGLGIYAAFTDTTNASWLVPLIAGLGVLGIAWLWGTGCSLVRSVAQPLQDALMFSRQVGAGNLTARPGRRGQAEAAELSDALDIMRKALVSIAFEINDSARGVVLGADRIAQGNADLASRTHQQAAALEETAASMEEFSSSIEQSADNARMASELAQQVSNKAGQGNTVVQDAVERMQAISESSQKITEIISVIDGIAFQTNILALNAAVEAARAGEQGRGFAVVAGEVRSLAQKSAQAAREIKHLIENSVNEIESGASLVQQAGTVMTEVEEAVQRVTALMGEIAIATQEQATGVAQVRQAIQQIDTVTQQNAALVEDAAAAASILRERSNYLRHAASVFIVSAADRETAARSARRNKKRAPHSDRSSDQARLHAKQAHS